MDLPAQKLLNMQAGGRGLAQWLEDQVVYGLAALESDPAGRLDQIAAQLTDAQLPGPASSLREWAPRIGVEEHWAATFAEELGYWHLQCKLLAGLTLPLDDFGAGVLLNLGQRVRTSTLRETAATHHDDWTCVGVETSEKANVHARRTYWAGTQAGHRALQLAFNYGSPPPPTQTSVGTAGAFAVHPYPGGLPGRALLPERIVVSTATEQPFCHDHWYNLRLEHEDVLLRQPWQREQLVHVGPLQARHDVNAGVLNLIDQRGEAMELAATADDASAWQLLGGVGDEPFTLYGVLRNQQLIPHSYWHAGQLHRLGS